MAKVGAQRAATMTGVSKATIQRAMKSGKLSYEVTDEGQKMIDTSELERAFGPVKNMGDDSEARVKAELQRAADMLEMERMKMRVRMLEDQLHTASSQMEDLKEQRDQWQKQAQQVLITSQNSQKAADDLKEELRERDRSEKEMRSKQMDLRRKQMELKLRAQNQNQPQEQNGFWGKLFKRA